MIVHPRCRVCQRIHGLPRCEPVAEPEEPVRNVTDTPFPFAPATNAERQAAYRAKHPEAVRAYDRQRKAAKRAAK